MEEEEGEKKRRHCGELLKKESQNEE